MDCTATVPVVCGLGHIAKKYNKPVVCLSGSVDYKEKSLYTHGISAMFSIINEPTTLKYAMRNANTLIQNAAENIIRLYMDKG